MAVFLKPIGGREPGRTPRPASRAADAASRVEIAIFAILGVAALRLGSELLISVTIAVLFSLLANGPVQWMSRRGLPAWLAATLVVGGGVCFVGGGVYLLARPATEWLARAPESLPAIEAKVRLLARPLNRIERTAQQVSQAASPSGTSDAPATVAVATPGWMMRVGGGTASIVTAFVTIIFLTFFLSSANHLLMRKLIGILPGRADQVRVLRAVSEIGAQTSRYLWLTTAISTGVAVATWLLLLAFGLPSALLLGAVAGLLNFVPYVGGLVSLVLIGGAGLIAFPGVERTVLMLGAFLIIHLLAGNVLTPAVLGRRLPMNTVAVFICLVFWSWTWGIPGAIMAVPLTVMFKVFCEHVPRLRAAALLLDS